MTVDNERDIALENATREKVVLTLGIDPVITGRAFEASRLYLAWADAERRLEEFKSEFRVYASKKRDIWNEANEDKVKTLKIPFRLKTERGVEVRHISVSCTASYTVEVTVLNKLKKEFPSEYRQLFIEETTVVVKPRGKEILRTQLRAAGLDDDRIRRLFNEVFDNEVTIKPIEDFEYKVEDVLRGAPDMAKKYVDLGVRRAVPTVTFEVR